jgi:hypothetical protein
MYLIIVYQNKEVLMKFFKISLLFSIGFIGLNMVTTSAGVIVGAEEQAQAVQAGGNSKLEKMAMDGVGGAKNSFTAVPRGTSVKIDLITGKSMYVTPAGTSSTDNLQQDQLVIDVKLQENFDEIHINTMKDLVQKVATYIVSAYGEAFAKQFMNDDTAKDASVVNNTLIITFGENFKDAVKAHLARKSLPQ